MSITIPASHQDLVEGPVVVVLATLMPNGQPHTAVVWRLFDGTHLLICTGRNRQKSQNMKAHPLVSILTLYPKNPGRYLEIRGRVEEITEAGAIPILDKMAQLYTGHPKYSGYLEPAEEEGQYPLLIFKIKPTRVVAVG